MTVLATFQNPHCASQYNVEFFLATVNGSIVNTALPNSSRPYQVDLAAKTITISTTNTANAASSPHTIGYKIFYNNPPAYIDDSAFNVVYSVADPCDSATISLLPAAVRSYTYVYGTETAYPSGQDHTLFDVSTLVATTNPTGCPLTYACTECVVAGCSATGSFGKLVMGFYAHGAFNLWALADATNVFVANGP